MATGGGMSDRVAKEAIKLLRQAAKNAKVQVAAVVPLAKAGAWTAKQVGGVSARPVKTYQLRRMAIDDAKQIQGLYSRGTILCGRRRHVVWKDGVPQRAYPPPSETELGGKAAQRAALAPGLQHRAPHRPQSPQAVKVSPSQLTGGAAALRGTLAWSAVDVAAAIARNQEAAITTWHRHTMDAGAA